MYFLARTIILLFSFWLCYVSGNVCLTSGRFPNDDVPDCRGYLMCIANGNGGFFQYNLTCPQSFVFSPSDKVCTNATRYHCGRMDVHYDCPSIGFFEDTHSVDCRTYLSCNLEFDNTISARVVDCPQGTFFNAVQGDCVNGTEYDCSPTDNTVPDFIEVNATEHSNRTKENSANQYQASYVSVISLTTFAVLSVF